MVAAAAQVPVTVADAELPVVVGVQQLLLKQQVAVAMAELHRIQLLQLTMLNPWKSKDNRLTFKLNQLKQRLYQATW